MKNIAITQRLIINQTYYEERECLDINYANLLEKCNFLPIALAYNLDFKNYFKELKIDGVIITGGNNLSAYDSKNKMSIKRDKYEKSLIEFCIKNKVPVYGICRGMQIIADYFGCSFKKVEGHVGNNHLINANKNSRFYNQLKEIKLVNSYHEYSIEDIDNSLIISATDKTGLIKALEHQTLKVFGQMWHSEREEKIPASHINLIKEFFK